MFSANQNAETVACILLIYISNNSEKKRKEKKHSFLPTVLIWIVIYTFLYFSSFFFADTANQSWLSNAGLPGNGHFFNGNDPNVQAAIQQNYIIVMKSQFVPPFFCSFNPECKEDNVQVFISTA